MMVPPCTDEELLEKKAVTESSPLMTELRSTDFRNEGMNLPANEENDHE